MQFVRPTLSTVRFVFAIAFFSSALRAEEPFVFEKTPGKLPKSVVPHHYAIRIEPDLAKATFVGSVAIDIEVRAPVKEIVLNSLDLQIGKAVLQTSESVAITPAMDAEKQLLTLPLPAELKPGKYKIALEFSGKLGEQPQGLFISRYQSGTDEKRALATQMEATDARRMFPCWDEPAFRAAFQLTAVVPEKLVAISNMPVTNEKPLGDGRKELVFAPTPSMASYLVALCVGEFEELRDELDGLPLRIFTTAGKREQGRHAMDATKKVLAYFNDYFGAKYPLPKLDQIALASTGASGMENWGLIIYNDTALLYDPATSSQATKERVFEIVAHELAHQWFGNLVTMAWWDNLWLNEGFASWMGTKATDRFNPEWKMWLRAQSDKEYAMILDARATTHPIQQPITDEAQASDAFDEITYLKGQSFLRMLESWLGEQPFRDGIRAYMKKHAYSSTTTADLWNALGESSKKPVREMAAGWTEQPGFPLVTLERVPSTDRHIVRLRQERFTIHQPGATPLKWQIPVTLRLSGRSVRDERSVLLQDEPLAVDFDVADAPAGTPIIGNSGGAGYFRVGYQPQSSTPSLAQLPEEDRLTLLSDTWALVQSGRAEPEEYLTLVAQSAGETSYPVMAQIIDAFWFIDALHRGEKSRADFRAWVRGFLRPQLQRLTWQPIEDEPQLNALLRSSVIRTLGSFGSEEVVREARERFAAFLEKPETLTGDLRAAVVFVIGRNANGETWDQLRQLARGEQSFEHKRNYLRALAASPRSEDTTRTLELALSDELPPRDATQLVRTVAQQGDQPHVAWAFAKKHHAALQRKLPGFSANDYFPKIAQQATDAGAADDLEAFARKNLPPGVARAVAEAADDIRFKAEFKRRLVPSVRAFLDDPAAPPAR